MRALLVDDEPLALDRMECLLAQIGGVTIVGCARDGEAAARMIGSVRPDLVLLDIQMPAQSGLAVAQSLDVSQGVQVVFVSAFDHYAAQAYDIDATDYLLKPVRRERLEIALQRVRRRASGSPREVGATEGESGFIWAPARHGSVRVPHQSINWVEAAGDYVLIHTAARTHMLRATISDMAERLEPAGIVRAHRSALVQPSAVAEITRMGNSGLALTMSDGASVSVGPSFQKALLTRLGARSEAA